jgi:glycosyltransferase involved in cell wall biosynthesis
MNGMRIVHLVEALGVGGAERIIIDESKGLARRGFDLRVCCLAAAGPLAEEARAAGIPVDALGVTPGLARPLAILRVREHLRALRPRIVHAHLRAASVYGRLAAWLASVPVIVLTEHNLYWERPLQHRFAERLLAERTAGMIAVCEAVREFAARQLWLSPDRFTVIYNGIDVARFQGQSLNGRGKGDRLRVIAIGRLTEQKGHTFLLDAVARMEPHERPLVSIVGDGPLRARLEAQAAAGGLSDVVRFLGVRGDVPQLVARCDVLVLPSLWEGLPLAAIEAMAAARPVIASRVGGVPEAVIEGETGILVPPGDSLALMGAIMRISRDPALVDRLARAGRMRAERLFDIETHVDALERFYLSLSSGR